MAGDDAKAKTVAAQLVGDLGFTSVDGGPLPNARLLESMGDFVRFLIGAQQMGPFTTLSRTVLPHTNSARLGGRQARALT